MKGGDSRKKTDEEDQFTRTRLLLAGCIKQTMNTNKSQNGNQLTQASTSQGLVSVEEQRAIQTVQAALVIAKKFPRDEKACLDRILNACTRPGLAAQSTYSYGRGGAEITGPSIRLAEAMAQNWGNIDQGFKEISRGRDEDVGYSEVEAFAWDMETNARKTLHFRVKHWRDTRQGGYPLKEERDIYELIANQAQRRVRACILAIIPGDIAEEAVTQCEATLKASADTSPEAIKKLVKAFEAMGVSKAQIEARIQRRLESIKPAQVISLRKVYTSLSDGMSSKEEWFDALDVASQGGTRESLEKFAKKASSTPTEDTNEEGAAE